MKNEQQFNGSLSLPRPFFMVWWLLNDDFYLIGTYILFFSFLFLLFYQRIRIYRFIHSWQELIIVINHHAEQLLSILWFSKSTISLTIRESNVFIAFLKNFYQSWMSRRDELLFGYACRILVRTNVNFLFLHIGNISILLRMSLALQLPTYKLHEKQILYSEVIISVFYYLVRKSESNSSSQRIPQHL